MAMSGSGAPTLGMRTMWRPGRRFGLGRRSETSRVLRGGSWSDVPRGFRAARRVCGDSGDRDCASGFRVARTLFSELAVGRIAKLEEAEKAGCKRAELERRDKTKAEAGRRQEQEEARRKAKAERIAREEVEDRRAGERDELRRIKPGSGERFKDINAGPEMVVIPAGKFVKGSPAGEEGPRHQVTIKVPFALGRFAVTLAEFSAFVESTGRAMSQSYKDPGFSQTPRHPVVGVSWGDAAAYCQWLSKTTGKTYRLPSEAEWEHACRAGSSTPFWWGASISTDDANYNGNYTYGGGKKGQYRKATVPVESFKPNPWGLYQMHGNVWEWCADPWHENYRGARKTVRFGKGATQRVVFCAAVPGAAIHGISARRGATGISPLIVSTTLVFALQGRFFTH